jgi:DNA gyrase subunit A
LWLATKHGSIKQLAAAEIRQCNRGDIGQICMRFGQRDNQVVDLQSSNTRVLGALLSEFRSVRIDLAELAGSPDGTQQLGLGNKEASANLVPLLS